MRNEVDKKINKLNESDKIYEIQEEMENAKILAIRNLQEEVSTEYYIDHGRTVKIL